MKRKSFIQGALATTILFSMDGFSTLVNAFEPTHQKNVDIEKFSSFGAVHLSNTSLKSSIDFWTKTVGLKLRKTNDKMAELGTDNRTLVVIHQTANKPYQKGYSGLYHLAIHAPNAAAFASMVNRLIVQKHPFSPVDHTMSKSVYFDDPDGINIEIALETPERFKRVISAGGLRIEGTDGVVRSASDQLDLEEVLSDLSSNAKTSPIADDTFIGHVHLYANDVVKSNSFYKKMGFIQFNFLPEYAYADVGAGGNYKHRIAMNSWHGRNKPLAPKGTAGLKHLEIIFQSEEKFQEALTNLPEHQIENGKAWFNDPTGNRVLLAHE